MNYIIHQLSFAGILVLVFLSCLSWTQRTTAR